VSLVLLYHAVFELHEGDRTLVVAPGELAWHLGALARLGFRSLTLEQFRAGEDDPETVLITFDDAYRHVPEVATPLLEEHGFTAVLFAPWGHVGGVNDWDEPPLPVHGLPICGPAELAAAAEGPWELASHGTSHVDLRALERTERLEQLTRSRLELSALAGRDVVELAYPYGLHDAAVRGDAREAGYRLAFTAGRSEAAGHLAVPRRTVRGQESRMAFKIGLDAELRRAFG
jgi:peptidoglycan/xylan/chitin deacetylase (PgdA/CDA1 family)